MKRKVHRAFVEERTFTMGNAFVACCHETLTEAETFAFSDTFEGGHTPAGQRALEYLGWTCNAEHVL